jgi:hypothetical protein
MFAKKNNYIFFFFFFQTRSPARKPHKSLQKLPQGMRQRDVMIKADLNHYRDSTRSWNVIFQMELIL